MNKSNGPKVCSKWVRTVEEMASCRKLFTFERRYAFLEETMWKLFNSS